MQLFQQNPFVQQFQAGVEGLQRFAAGALQLPGYGSLSCHRFLLPFADSYYIFAFATFFLPRHAVTLFQLASKWMPTVRPLHDSLLSRRHLRDAQLERAVAPRKQRAAPRRVVLRDAAAFGAIIPGDSVVEQVVTTGFLNFLNLYNSVLVVRLVLTWFPSVPEAISSPIATVCDPYLNLFR